MKKSAPERTRTLGAAGIKVFAWRLKQAGHIGEHFRIVMVIPHARHLVANDLQTAEQAGLALWVARRDYERADYGSARKLEEQALASLCRLQGE